MTYRKAILSAVLCGVLLVGLWGCEPAQQKSRSCVSQQFKLASVRVLDPNGQELTSAVHVKIHGRDGFFNISLQNSTDAPIRVGEVVLLDIAHGWPGDSVFYGEGFTMLSQTGGTLANMQDLDGLTDRGHYKLPEPKGFRTVYGMMHVTPPGADAVLLGFSSCRRFVGKFDVSTSRLRVVVNTEGLTLQPNAHWTLEELAMLSGPDKNVLLKKLAERLSSHHRRLPWPDLPTGWCSWYCFGPNVTAKNILDNMTAFKQHLPQVRYIQIDDGYQPWMGDWLEPNPAFGGTLREVIARIRETGFEPAIWVAPFIASPQSRLFNEHPDWFIRDDEGRPLPSNQVTFGGWRQGPWYMLDGSHPDAQRYLEHVFGVMRREWGCTYFKLDATAWGAMPFGHRFDPDASSIEAFRRGMDAVRRGAGNDAFLLGCNHPMWPSMGTVHGSRSSMDIVRNWDVFKQTARENLLRSWQNGQLWWNDPDCLVLSGDLPDNEKRFHASVIYATGGMLLSGDDAAGYGPQQWTILKKAAANPGLAAVFEDMSFEVGRIDQPEQTLAVFLNWSGEPARRQIQLDRPCRVLDFWTDEDLGVFDSTFYIDSFPARCGGIYLLKPAGQ